MTYMTKPFLDFVFAVIPYWLPLLIVYLVSIYLLIMKERFDPRTFIFWMAVVLTVPFLGFALYLMFGSTLYSGRVFGRKRRDDSRIMDVEASEPGTDLPGILRKAGADAVTCGNRARFYWEAEDMASDIVDDLRSAERRIVVSVRRLPRETGAVLDLLISKARSGVEVLILTSSMGFGRTPGLKDLKRAGIVHATFHNILYSMFSVRSANRDKRTFMVIDGRISYQGGGAFVRTEGPAASRLESRFAADWFHATGREIPVTSPAAGVSGGADVQAVADGPDHWGDTPMEVCYSGIISSAKRSLMISSPYLMPNDDIFSMVKMAVMSGVEVILLLPGKARHWYQKWNSLAASNPMMIAGVKVHFVDRMMSKCVMVADGRVCCVGSGEFCSVALHDDFSISQVIYSEEVASEAESCFRKALAESVECLPEEYVRRSFSDRLKIMSARMFMLFN